MSGKHPPENDFFPERLAFEKGKNARLRHSAARPEVSGKTAFFRETTGRMI